MDYESVYIFWQTGQVRPLAAMNQNNQMISCTKINTESLIKKDVVEVSIKRDFQFQKTL